MPIFVGHRGRIADDENLGVPGQREIGVDFDATGAIRLGIEPAHRRRSRHSGRPDDGAGIDTAVLKIDPVCIALRDERFCPDLDAHARQRFQCIVRQPGRERWQQSWSCLDQYDARRARIDAAEIGGECLARNIRDRTGHLDAGGTAADDDESQQASPLVFVFHNFRALKGNQDAAADSRAIFNSLQAGRIARPLIVTEIRVRGTGRDHQIVVGNFAGLRLNALLLRADAAHIFHENRGIALRAQNVPDRPGDIRRRQCRGCHLIKKRLEAMVILSVDHRHIGLSPSQRFGAFQAAKARPDDYDPCIACHGPSSRLQTRNVRT